MYATCFITTVEGTLDRERNNTGQKKKIRNNTDRKRDEEDRWTEREKRKKKEH